MTNTKQPKTPEAFAGLRVTRKRLWTGKDKKRPRALVYIDILLPQVGITMKKWTVELHHTKPAPRAWERRLSLFSALPPSELAVESGNYAHIKLLPPLRPTTKWSFGSVPESIMEPTIRIKKSQRESFRLAVLKAADACPFKPTKPRKPETLAQ